MLADEVDTAFPRRCLMQSFAGDGVAEPEKGGMDVQTIRPEKVGASPPPVLHEPQGHFLVAMAHHTRRGRAQLQEPGKLRRPVC